MSPELALLLSQSVNCLQSNDDRAAEIYLTKAIALDPNNPDALRFLGIIEAKRDCYEKALHFFQRALDRAPNNAVLYDNKGSALQGLKRYEEALVAYDKAISIAPNYAEAYSNKGNALQGLKRYEEALVAYDKAISIAPNYAEANSNKGNALLSLKLYKEALVAYEKAISIYQKDAKAYGNKGAALYGLKRYEEALIACNEAILLNPDYVEAYRNKAKTLEALGLFEEAFRVLEAALKIQPNYEDAHFDMSFLYLKKLAFQAGWEKYEWRWLVANSNSPKLNSSKPVWDGKRTELRILVWAEQGIGDKVLYSSMFEELGHLVSKVIISTDKRLIPIYKRSFPAFEFVDSSTHISEERYDVQVPIGSLTKFMRLNTADFKKPSFPYLIDSQDRTIALRDQVNSIRSGKATCGISWRSINQDIGDHKSIPISKIAPILEMEQFEFINLQYGDISGDLESLKSGGDKKIHQIPNINLHDDIDSCFSLIQACDVIVTSSNSVAHMAGALNKKTILILPKELGRLWYWHEIDGHSLCYPSIKIFSQTQDGSWDEVIFQVKSYMETLSFE